MYKLSIITAVYNSSINIENTLKNVKNLKENNEFEYIVIDGASTDGTLEILYRYSYIIDKLISENDNGIYDAMNKGIKLASGKYIGLLNAGDTYNYIDFPKVVKIINSQDYDIIYGNMNMYDENSFFIKHIKANSSLRDIFFCGPKRLNHPTVFTKRNVYQELGFFNQNYSFAGDFEFMYLAYLKGYKFFNTNFTHTNFHLGGASYRTSSYQAIRIYFKYLKLDPFIGTLSILQKILLRYPRFLILKIVPKRIHYKYLKTKTNIINKFIN